MDNNAQSEATTVSVNGQTVPWNVPVPKTAGAFTGGVSAAVLICVADKYGVKIDPSTAYFIIALAAGMLSYMAPHANVTKGKQ